MAVLRNTRSNSSSHSPEGDRSYAGPSSDTLRRFGHAGVTGMLMFAIILDAAQAYFPHSARADTQANTQTALKASIPIPPALGMEPSTHSHQIVPEKFSSTLATNERTVGNDTLTLTFENTKFYGQVTTVAGMLGEGWRVKTTPVGTDGAGCLVLYESPSWEGCVDTFDGFEYPNRSGEFEPTGYLVFAAIKDDTKYDHVIQKIFAAKPNESGLPLASGHLADGSLVSSSSSAESRAAAKKFGFIFPESDNYDPAPDGSIIPLGYWALGPEEFTRVEKLDITVH